VLFVSPVTLMMEVASTSEMSENFYHSAWCNNQKMTNLLHVALPLGNCITKGSYTILKLSSLKMIVFWVLAPCKLVRVYQRFRGLYCFHHQGDE
jgi:hypothetical protein